ncbi:plastocyanin/azurin family copper-binding protein [Aliamphritea ceti]|uniref:plastocyanin/azurin family copper-binding protein n=1 Tax=Aliamphritea ceti TaxID=1524258 RepID=UPI0021C27F60|nr:plastocyanin/azurin family copper-binding protein [Aliamphritea ceti]
MPGKTELSKQVVNNQLPDISRRNWLFRVMQLGGALALPVPLVSLAAQQYKVSIQSFAFVPAQLKVAPGDQITWFNEDIVPHTATAKDHSWDTGIIEPGQQVTVQIPAGAGAEYYCLYHPMMLGSIS